MWYKVAYILYLFCTIFLTAPFGIIPLSPRQYCAVIMLFVCVTTDKKIYCDKYWILYLVFIYFFGLSSLFTNYFNQFILRLIGDFFVAFVACWATKILVLKYKAKEIVVYSLIFFGVFDSIITIGQVMRWPFANLITAYFNLDLYESYYDYADSSLNLMTFAIPGFFRSAVDNGHFLSVSAISSIALLPNKRKYLTIPCVLFIFVGSFMAQQRSGFYLAVILGVLLLFKYISESNNRFVLLYFFLIAIVLTLLFSFFSNLILSTDSRFTEYGLDTTGRGQIWNFALDYISNNLFLGGFFRFLKETQEYPHNVIISAFLSGGLLGGLALLLMLIQQLLEVLRYVVNKHSLDIGIIVFAFSFIATVGDSLMHNISVANGDVITWVVWTAFYYSVVSSRVSQ